MRALWQSFLHFFTSLKLTVWLLVLSMLLVFFATIDQRELGVFGIQQKWFYTFIVIHFIKGFPAPVFLGGYTIGGLLFANLVAAFICRFKFTWKKSGIWLTHAGLILLLIGGFLSGIMQEDYQMRIREGETKNYSESFHLYELAILDTTPAGHDNVTAIPDAILSRARASAPLDLGDAAGLPFRATIRAYYENAVLVRPGSDPRFATHHARGEHQVELDDMISAWTKSWSSADLLAHLEMHGVPAGKIYKAPDMLEDPHFKAREAIIKVQHPAFQNLWMQNVFPKLSETPGEVAWAGPELGQHNEEIYGDILGMSRQQMNNLEDEGVI